MLRYPWNCFKRYGQKLWLRTLSQRSSIMNIVVKLVFYKSNLIALINDVRKSARTEFNNQIDFPGYLR